MPVALRPAVALLAACAALAACDAEPGFADAVRPPALSAVAVTPVSARLDTDALTASVPLTVAGTLDAQGATQIRVLVRWAETDSLVTEVSREIAQPGPFQVDVPLAIPRGAVGDYSVRISTEGADRRPGDQAAAVFRFQAASLGPPTVSANAPAAIERPTGPQRRTIQIVATVSDPDGRANIAIVALQVPGGGVVGRLFDGGGSSDDTPGDGRYSRGIVIDSEFELGTYDLEIIAVDRAGEVSLPAPVSFTVR